MTMTDDLKSDADMLTVGTVPLHPGVLDYADTDGKIILFVRDQEEGRSLFMAIEMYGELGRMYEVKYDDFSDTLTRMMGEVIVADSDDPYYRLIMGETNDSTQDD